MYRLKVKTHFDAAHYLKDYLGKCQRLHGHRWVVECCFEGKELGRVNMLVDFSLVKKLVGKLLEELDHYSLNDQLGVEGSSEENPTAEFVARWLFSRMKDRLRAAHTPPINHEWLDAFKRGVKLVQVTICESPECCVEYSEGES